MKTQFVLGLGFLPGLLIGLLLESKTDHEPTSEGDKSFSERRQITKRISERKDNPVSTQSKKPLALSDGRSTYYLLELSKLTEEISQLTLADFPEVIDRANEDSRIEVLLYRRWSKLDPRGALTYLLEETDYNSLDCLEDDLPDVALLAGAALLQREKMAAIPLILRLMERVSEGSIGYNYGDFDGYENLFSTWATIDFDGALDFLMIQQEGYWYDGSNRGLASGAAKAGKTRELMEWISTNPETFLAYDFVRIAMSEWAEKDLPAALQFAQSGKTPIEENALEGIADTWIEKDVDAFLDWALKTGPSGISITRESARKEPHKLTAFLEEHDDGSSPWQNVRSELLKPLQYHGSPIAADLDRYFRLINGLRDKPAKRREQLGKLFLKYTDNPTNWNPEGERPFAFHKSGPIDELVEKHGYQNEFAEFKKHQEILTTEVQRIKKEMTELGNTRNKLHWESGLEEAE